MSPGTDQDQPAGDAPSTGVRIIESYLRERFRPAFRVGNSIVGEDGETTTKAVGCDSINSQLTDLLALASDAPRDNHGRVKRERLTAFYKSWATVAWNDLCQTLPTEDDAKLAADSATGEEFRRMVRDALLKEVVLGDVIKGTTATQTERRPLLDWCERFAKPGRWSSVRGKRCWCRCAVDEHGELILQVALRVELFSQLQADRRLCQMTANTFAARCEKYGVGASTRAERPEGKAAVVLSDSFIKELTAGVASDEELDPAEILEQVGIAEHGGG